VAPIRQVILLNIIDNLFNKFLDINYSKMRVDIELYYQGNIGDFKDLHEQRLVKAQNRILLEYCARRLYLRLLLSKFPKLTPKEYCNMQLDGGMHTIKELVKLFKKFTPSDIITIIDSCNLDLKVF
jgi:hypothetical protein